MTWHYLGCRRFSFQPLLLCLSSVGLLVVSIHVEGAGYKFTDLGTLGGTYSIGYGINDSGQVAGLSKLPGNVEWHATRWDSTTPTDLGTLGGRDSYAVGINNAGQVVGYSFTADGGGQNQHHATRWDGNTPTDLGTLGGRNSSAYGINEAGQIAGWADRSDVVASRATKWDGTTPTDLGTLGGHDSFAFGINNAGQVTGDGFLADDLTRRATKWDGATTTNLGTLGGVNSHSYGLRINDVGQVIGGTWLTLANGPLRATEWDGATLLELGSLGGRNSSALGLNNLGQVVGESNILGLGYENLHATLWKGTVAIDLNSLLDADGLPPGWYLSSARDINENGWITGQAVNRLTGEEHAYVLSLPVVPEPDTWGLMVIGVGISGLVICRRRNAVA